MASSATSSTSIPISHLSIINVSNFVSSKLHGNKKSNNYSSWKKQMLCLIESQNLLRFINGKINPHEEEDDVIVRTDRLVMGWILGALDEAVLQSVANLTTATAVWSKLENIFVEPSHQPPLADGEELRHHIPLYKAALRGDWSKAKEILDQDPNAMEAKLNPTLQTALHVAVGTGEAIDFVTELVDSMPNHLLRLKDYLGFTALHVAAQSGNTEAARILVGKLPDLLHEPNKAGEFPVHTAAIARHEVTLEYFIYETKDETLYDDKNSDSGIKLLCMLIDAKIFGIALHLAEKYPNLARATLKNGDCALKRIALTKAAFPRERIFRCFYNTVDTNHEDSITTKTTGDIEGSSHPENSNPDSSTWFKPLYEYFHFMAYAFVSVLYNSGWHYGNPGRVKQRQEHALKLVKCLCKSMESLEYDEASAMYEDAILTAARSGIPEIIKEIAVVFPAAVYAKDTLTGQSIFHVAAENHQREVFDLIKERNNIKHQMSDMTDIYGNTVLHSAARLGSHYSTLKYRSGAALRMQKEMLWFDKIRKLVQPDSRQKVNGDGKTAWTVFDDEHAALKAQVEEWEKDTSQACSIVAALIATVTFTAAIPVPGGLDSSPDSGHLPVFSDRTRFKAFTWCTIISFFTSITCLFLFLSSNISLFPEQIRLPVKTILNLFFLFISAICMMGAFISAIYLLLKDLNAVIGFTVLLLYVLIPSYLFLFNYIPLLRTLQIYFKELKRK